VAHQLPQCRTHQLSLHGCDSLCWHAREQIGGVGGASTSTRVEGGVVSWDHGRSACVVGCMSVLCMSSCVFDVSRQQET